MNRIIGYALAAIIIASTSFVASTQAADQIRIRLNNKAGFIIDSIRLTRIGINGPTLGRDKKNFPFGSSRNVKWTVTGEYPDLDLYVDYDIWKGGDQQKCGKVASLKLNWSTKQITNVFLPGDSKVTPTKLDNNKDEIVLLDFNVTGTIHNSKCKYNGVRVSKR